MRKKKRGWAEEHEQGPVLKRGEAADKRRHEDKNSENVKSLSLAFQQQFKSKLWLHSISKKQKTDD